MSLSQASTTYERDTINVQVHNLGANLIFAEHGLSPYRGLVNAYDPHHATTLGTFEVLGNEWEIKQSNHWHGAIADPEGRIDDGLYEYQYTAVCDDGVADMDISVQLRPGLPDARHVETGDPIGGMPDDCPESIRVQLESTNLTRSEALEVLRALADHIDLNSTYFETPHDWSRIYSIEAYTRIDREIAESKITGSGGIIEHIGGFGGRQGGKGEHKWDHEQIQGHYEAVALGPETWQMLIDEQTLAKRVKCYHPKDPRGDMRKDDPLYHPKLEVQYWQGYDKSESIPWDGYDYAVSELETTAVNVLSWAGVSVLPDHEVYVEDAYYEIGTTDREIEVYSNPMPDLREQQELHAEDELMRESLGDAEFDALLAIADGGGRQYDDLADEAGVSTSTVYRLLEKLSSVLESNNGLIDFVDTITREHVTGIVDRLRETADWARQNLREVLQDEQAVDGDGDDPTPLERWMSRHGILLESHHDDLHFRIEGQAFSDRQIIEILRSGYDAAVQSGMRHTRFLDALVSWKDLDGNHRNGWKAFVHQGSELRILGQEPLNA